MAQDDRDVLEVLKAELDFVEKGGYGRSVRTPWLPTSIFRDSPTCLNFGDPQRTHPCDECLLMTLVPAARRGEDVPCHYIPLTPDGETIVDLERGNDQGRLEEIVSLWLHRMVGVLEDVRGTRKAS